MADKTNKLLDKVLKLLGPLFVVIFGIVLKILLLDFEKIPKDNKQLQLNYIQKEYINPIWLDLILSSFFLLIGLSLKESAGTVNISLKTRLFGFLGLVSLGCLICLSIAKLGIFTNMYVTMVIPNALSLIFFSIISWITSKSTE